MNNNLESNNVNNQNNNKSNKGIIIVLIILLLIALSVGGYFGYRYFTQKTGGEQQENNNNTINNNQQENNNQQQDNNDINQNNNTTNNDQQSNNIDNSSNQQNDNLTEIDINSNLVKNTMKQAFNSKKENYYVKNITKKELVELAIEANMPSSCSDNFRSGPIYTIDKINEGLKTRVYNARISIDDIRKNSTNVYDNVYNVSNGNMYFLVKIDNNLLYIEGPCGGMEGPVSEHIEEKITKAEKNNTYLNVYVKEAYAKLDMDNSTFYNPDNLIYNFYNNYKYEGSIIETKINSQFGNNIKIDWDKYNTYKYTFNLIDGIYYFESFEMVG